MYSIYLIVGVIIGGLMSIWGGVIGSMIILTMREGLRGIGLPAWEVVIMGVLTVIVLMLFERGISGYIGVLYSGWIDRVRSRRKEMPIQPPMSRVEIPTQPHPFPLTANPENSPILVVRNASKHFGSLKAVDDVSFDIARHSITSLIGPNGAGKTTLFNLISGHLPMTAGEILFENKRIGKLHPNKIASLGVARTFQSLHLFHNLTVLQNVMCGRHRLTSQNFTAVSLRTPRIDREEKLTRDAARYFLNYVNLGGFETFFPGELSFGHQRLVEIARALALEPALILMDEPASGLNDTETEHLAELLFRIRQNGTTILLVEHDIRLVMGASDHIVVMNYGQKLAEGPIMAVRNDPKVIMAYLGGEANGHDA
jgi:ABC-type branched-subunit amino acid transport system ATPase component